MYDPNNQAAIYNKFDTGCDQYLKGEAQLCHHFEVNCRNTKSVVEAVSDYTGGDVGAPSITTGNIPEILIADSPLDAAGLLRKHIQGLLNSQIHPSNITILTPTPNNSCSLLPPMENYAGLLKRFTPEMANPKSREGITLATPKEFKGLESPFIYLIDAYSFKSDKEIAELYVSMTRSLINFCMVTNKLGRMDLQEKFEENLLA